MADDSSIETKLAELSKSIQDQSRFTRAIMLVCTSAVMAVLFWSIVQIFTILPSAVVLQFMNNMPSVVTQWRFYEVNQTKPHEKAGTGDAAPAASP